uniref:hypothetical protein n=1 Tax=Sphaeromyxa zaharoni TaxID=275449 RepID=UPI003001F601
MRLLGRVLLSMSEVYSGGLVCYLLGYNSINKFLFINGKWRVGFIILIVVLLFSFLLDFLLGLILLEVGVLWSIIFKGEMEGYGLSLGDLFIIIGGGVLLGSLLMGVGVFGVYIFILFYFFKGFLFLLVLVFYSFVFLKVLLVNFISDLLFLFFLFKSAELSSYFLVVVVFSDSFPLVLFLVMVCYLLALVEFRLGSRLSFILLGESFMMLTIFGFSLDLYFVGLLLEMGVVIMVYLVFISLKGKGERKLLVGLYLLGIFPMPSFFFKIVFVVCVYSSYGGYLCTGFLMILLVCLSGLCYYVFLCEEDGGAFCGFMLGGSYLVLVSILYFGMESLMRFVWVVLLLDTGSLVGVIGLLGFIFLSSKFILMIRIFRRSCIKIVVLLIFSVIFFLFSDNLNISFELGVGEDFVKIYLGASLFLVISMFTKFFAKGWFGLLIYFSKVIINRKLSEHIYLFLFISLCFMFNLKGKGVVRNIYCDRWSWRIIAYGLEMYKVKRLRKEIDNEIPFLERGEMKYRGIDYKYVVSGRTKVLGTSDRAIESWELANRYFRFLLRKMDKFPCYEFTYWDECLVVGPTMCGQIDWGRRPVGYRKVLTEYNYLWMLNYLKVSGLYVGSILKNELYQKNLLDPFVILDGPEFNIVPFTLWITGYSGHDRKRERCRLQPRETSFKKMTALAKMGDYPTIYKENSYYKEAIELVGFQRCW